MEIRESCCVTVLAQLRAAEMGRAVPARARGQGHRHRGPAPRVRPGDVARSPARSWWSSRRCAPTSRCCTRRSATRPATCTSTSPTCSTSASRTASRDGRRHRGPAGVHGRGGRGGVIVPAHLVAAVAEAPFGAHPRSCYPGYAYDRPHLAGYLPRRRPAATSGGLPRPVRPRRRGRLPGPRRPGPSHGLDGVRSRPGRSCSGELDDRRVVRGRAGPHDRATGRSCSTASRARARRSPCTSPSAPTPRTGCWWRARRTRSNPDAGVHPADQQRPRPAPGRGLPDAVRGVLRRGLPRRRSTGCSSPAARSTGTATPT